MRCSISAASRPSEEYTDRVTGKRLAPLTTGQIYWGVIPFVVIQVIMVGIVIAFPRLVTGVLDKGTGINPEQRSISRRRPPTTASPPTSEIFTVARARDFRSSRKQSPAVTAGLFSRPM